MITVTDNQFYTNSTWSKPITDLGYVPGPHYVELFDQNGYRLTQLEGIYSHANDQPAILHRSEYSLKKDWFIQEYADTGAVLNHGALFERKGYSEEAREQLSVWAEHNNLIYKLLRYKPKWGVDFSIDYVDAEGNAFEIVHYEYDGFELDEILEAKAKVEKVVASTDWNDAAKQLLKRKSEWIDLEFFAMSDYKCNFFGLGSERFKLVAWE
jgi:hypothetical protein